MIINLFLLASDLQEPHSSPIASWQDSCPLLPWTYLLPVDRKFLKLTMYSNIHISDTDCEIVHYS